MLIVTLPVLASSALLASSRSLPIVAWSTEGIAVLVTVLVVGSTTLISTVIPLPSTPAVTAVNVKASFNVSFEATAGVVSSPVVSSTTASTPPAKLTASAVSSVVVPLPSSTVAVTNFAAPSVSSVIAFATASAVKRSLSPLTVIAFSLTSTETSAFSVRVPSPKPST